MAFHNNQPLPCCPTQDDDNGSSAQLFAALYEELRLMAQRELRRASGSLTLSAGTLLHELYLNLQQRQGLSFPDEGRFLVYATRAMRGLMIDYSRRRQAIKRGAEFQILSLPADTPDLVAESLELERVGEAVAHLEAAEPRLARIIDLKYFSGFSFADIGSMLGLSERTVQRDWQKARVFLYDWLARADDEKGH